MRISPGRRTKITRDGLLAVTEPSGEGVACVVSGCDNPRCVCRDLLISAIPIHSWVRDVRLKGDVLQLRGDAHEDRERSSRREPMQLRVDVDEGLLRDGEGAVLDVARQPWLAVLEQALDASLLDDMARRLALLKGETIDEGSRLAEPDVEDWKPGDLVAWHQVFPTLRNDDYNLDDTIYMACDMYCVTPECECGEATVHFTVPEEPIGAVEVRLADGSANLVPYEEHETTLRNLWQRYLRRHHGTGHLRERDREMKRFGAEVLFEPVPRPERRAGPKVGRNEPCPCGSGKKFKKCCLGKAG